MKFNTYLQNLKNYIPGKPIQEVMKDFGILKRNIIKLASNENPQGPSKKAIKAIKLAGKSANCYPDDSMIELKTTISKKYKIDVENIIIGAGSDQIIEFAINAKTNEKRGILTSQTTFAMYEIYANMNQAPVFKTKNGEHILSEFLEVYESNKDKIAIIFLCIPNNPLGDCLDYDEISEFISKVDANTLVVIDGAYNEFAGFRDKKKLIEPKRLLKEFSNVLYLGTFSKLYGLGGLRVGYGISAKNIISVLHKIRPPFNVNAIGLVAANVSMNDENFIQKTLKNNLKEMKKFEKFAQKNRIKFIKSYTNFITFFINKDSSQVCSNLLKKGIIIRDLKSYNINAIRITIGTQRQNPKVLKLLRDELNE